MGIEHQGSGGWLPVLAFLVSGQAVNTLVLWALLRFGFHRRDEGLPIRTFIASPLVLAAAIVSVPFKFLGFGILSFSKVLASLGGMFLGVAVPDLPEKTAGDASQLYLIALVGIYFGLAFLGLSPVDVAAWASGERRDWHPTVHSIPAAEYRGRMMSAILESYEGPYNVGFDLTDPKETETRYFIRNHSGNRALRGTVESWRRRTADGDLPPEAVVAQFGSAMRMIESEPSWPSFMMKFSVLFNNRQLDPVLAAVLSDSNNLLFLPDLPAPPGVARRVEQEATPTAEQLKFLLDEYASAAPTTATLDLMTQDAKALILNEKDLSAYRARFESEPSSFTDHRAEDGSDGRPANRLLSVADSRFESPYGPIRIVLEVHRFPETAAGDVFVNKLRLPLDPPVGGNDRTEVLVHPLTLHGDRYVAIRQLEPAAKHPIEVVSEGCVRNVWFRIEAPVQKQLLQTAQIYRLLNLQRIKVVKALNQARAKPKSGA